MFEGFRVTSTRPRAGRAKRRHPLPSDVDEDEVKGAGGVDDDVKYAVVSIPYSEAEGGMVDPRQLARPNWSASRAALWP